MSEKDPPRLIDDPELGSALRAARDEAMSPERLTANARALDARLTKLPPPGRFPLGTSALTLGAIAGVIVLLRLVAGPVIFGGDSLATLTPTPFADSSPNNATPAIAVVATAPDVTPTRLSEVLATSPTPPPPSRGEGRDVRTAIAASPSPTPTAAPVGGTLADELRLYDGARALSRSGDHAGSLASLDELVRRFPKSSLAPEAAITRAEVLVASGRLDDASALLARLVGEPAHAGRRAELLRTLGDVERSRGYCPTARQHYRAALDAGATGEEASAARRGLGACEAGE